MWVRYIRAVALVTLLVHSTFGFAQQQRVAVEKAVSQDRESVVQPKADATPYINRGNERFEQGEYERAIEDYTTAIRLAPDSAIAFRKRGDAFAMTGKYQEAVADCNQSIRLDPSDSLTFNLRGNAWWQLGDVDKAIADLNEAIRLDPSFAAHVKQWSVPSSEQEKEFAEVSLDQALSVPAEALAQGYLAVEYNSTLANYVAEHGWQLQTSLDGHPITLTKDNIGTFLPSLEQRLATYENAIQERGYCDLSGAYIARVGADCEELGIQSGPTLIDQSDFRVTLTQLGIVYRGIVVESSLVLEDSLNSEITLVGRAMHDSITLEVQLQGFTKSIQSADCQVVLRKSDRIDKRFATVFVFRSLDALLNHEECGRALKEVSEAIRIDPEFPVALAIRSQILSSAPDSRFRDGELALRDAKHACELTKWKQWQYLLPLAAAYAESGDHQAAIRWIRDAIKSAPPEYHEELEGARDLFQQEKPLRFESDSIDIFSPLFESLVFPFLESLDS